MSKKRDKFTQGFHLVNGVYDDVEFDVVFCFVTDELFLYFFFMFMLIFMIILLSKIFSWYSGEVLF